MRPVGAECSPTLARAGVRTPTNRWSCSPAEARGRNAWRHVAAQRVERGGLLVGEAFARDEDPRTVALVHVHAPPCRPSRTRATPLLAAAWKRRSGTPRARRCARASVVVGWFHSHPGIGAFFSGTDRRTQAAFFPHAFTSAG